LAFMAKCGDIGAKAEGGQGWAACERHFVLR